MKIVYDPIFLQELKNILQNISYDKPSASRRFGKEIKTKIKQIPQNPFMYRKSIYFDDIYIRDMIHKGYTIIYEVNPTKKQLNILSIFNQNKPE